MEGISSEDLKKIGKVIFLCVLIYALINHAIRGVAREGGHQTVNSLERWSLGAPTAAAIIGVDQFRFATGEWVSGFASYCPQSITGSCRDGLYVIRVILGLH